MEDLDAKTIKWGIFMTAALRVAVHLGNDYAENLHSIKNQPKRTKKQLLNVTEKLIRDHKKSQVSQ